jgi:hypothetical protein
MRYILKSEEHFALVGQSECSESMRSLVRFSQSGVLKFTLFATCVLILLFLLYVRRLAHGQQLASFTDSLEASTQPGSF